MGEARRRGTREQRVEQSVERKRLESEARAAAAAARAAEAERVRKLPPEVRKEMMFRRSKSMLARADMLALLATANLAALPISSVDDLAKRRYRK